MKRLVTSMPCLLLSLALYGCTGVPRGVAVSEPGKVQATSPSQPAIQTPTPSPYPSPEDPKVVKRRKQMEKDMLAGRYHHDGSIELLS